MVVMKTVPIVFAFDENFVMPAAVCWTSLLENANEDTFYDIFVIHPRQSDFSNSVLAEFPKRYPRCMVTFRCIDDTFDNAYEVRGITNSTYYRLLIPQIIPEYEKVVYSDVDVVFQDDLNAYYETDMGDNYIAGVDTGTRLRPWIQKHVTDDLKLDWKDGYFYAGNIIMNSALIRKDGVMDSFKELSKQNWLQQDMDIINIACNKHILRLSPAYCLTNYLYGLMVNQRDEMVKDFGEEEVKYALTKGIVHYNGDKPWKTWCHHYDIWWEYYRKSPVFDEKWYMDFYDAKANELDKLSLKKRIKILARYFIVGRKK